jgi:hypothetical protein
VDARVPQGHGTSRVNGGREKTQKTQKGIREAISLLRLLCVFAATLRADSLLVMSMNELVIERTRRWIESIVIGLNLCPFAQRVFAGDKIRYQVSAATTEAELLRDLTEELNQLAATPIETVETTLLIHPNVFNDFLDYNDFLDVAEQRLAELDLDGVIQIASFHPDYRFADTEADAVENYTNRSPYPMLHLLREASIDATAENEEALLDIPQRNIETLRALGRAGIAERLRNI